MADQTRKLEYLLVVITTTQCQLTFKVIDGCILDSQEEAEEVLKQSNSYRNLAEGTWRAVVSANRYHAVITTAMETLNREAKLVNLIQQVTNITTIFGGKMTLEAVGHYLKASHRGGLWERSRTINYILDNTNGTGERKQD